MKPQENARSKGTPMSFKTSFKNIINGTKIIAKTTNWQVWA